MSSDRRERGRSDRHARRERGPGGLGGPFGVLWDAPATAGASGRRGRGGGLTRDEIVATALRIADAEGPDAVSMRRIGKELGVGTMSLYHHVPTKDDLLALMHDVVMGELVIPAEEMPAGWREGLTAIARRTRDVFTRHPWMVSDAWERPQMGPQAFAHVDQSLGVFAGMDLPIQTMGEILGAADDYTMGFMSRHAAMRRALARAGMEMSEYQRALAPYVRRMVEIGDYPNLRRFDVEDWRIDDDARFEQGLRWLLDGVEAALAQASDRS